MGIESGLPEASAAEQSHGRFCRAVSSEGLQAAAHRTAGKGKGPRCETEGTEDEQGPVPVSPLLTTAAQ